jgi:hypothetical protein
MAEVQRDSYEAFTENLTAAQRRTIGLAEGGLKFIRLQEDSARAAQEWFVSRASTTCAPPRPSRGV